MTELIPDHRRIILLREARRLVNLWLELGLRPDGDDIIRVYRQGLGLVNYNEQVLEILHTLIAIELGSLGVKHTEYQDPNDKLGSNLPGDFFGEG